MSQPEEFAEWMLLEAKASREGLPVEPDIESVAIALDEHFRKIAAEFLRLVREQR